MIRLSRRSLRQRLLILLLGSVTSLWLLFGALIREEVRHEAEEVFDANLVQLSKLLLVLVEGELGERVEHRWHLIGPYQLDEIARQYHSYEHKVAFQIFDAEGEVLLKSPQAPFEPLSTRLGQFEERLINSQRWRTFSLAHPQAVIHVGELIEVRDEVAEEVTEHLLEFALLSLPMLALMIWWAVHSGLRPITLISRKVAARDSHNLRQIDFDTAPHELQPLIDALNRLFLRLQQSIEKERRFTADAAHELRTPLAAIRIQAEVARNAEDGDGRVHALGQIIEGVDRTTHLVEQLLALSRIDGAETIDPDMVSVELEQIARENIEILLHQAGQVGVTLSPLHVERIDTHIHGNRELISTLLRNLIDNAIRYTPAGGNVSVSILRSAQDSMQIVVRDTGPGIPEMLKEQIFERFFRNSSVVSGSGLGLSICQRIAEIHTAGIKLQNRSNPDGLEVTVTFPIDKIPSDGDTL